MALLESVLMTGLYGKRNQSKAYTIKEEIKHNAKTNSDS